VVDPRFSDPKAEPTPWDAAVELFTSSGVCWITTVRADGRPHVTPLVGVWSEGRMHFCTGVGEQKEVNLRTNPHVVIATGANKWDSAADVAIEGTAVPVTGRADLVRLAKAWTSKWDGRWDYVVGDGCFQHDEGSGGFRVLVFAIEPDRAFAWSEGDPFGQTGYRFEPEGN
jgi:general stress protein 26